MNQKEISNLITQIARIRNVDITYVVETLKLAILEGIKRRFGKNVKAEIEFRPDPLTIEVFLLKKVVDQVKDPITEISLEDAIKYTADAQLESVIRIPLPLLEIGRSAIRKASDELMVKLREAERNKLFEEYLRKRGEIVSGTITKIDEKEIAVNIGLVEAILQNRDQLKTDHYRIGGAIKAIIYKVEKTPIGPRIYLSRTHNEFLKKLLTQEVPEIKEGIVEIKAIARLPGFRAKVAVVSNDERVDPVGACVGYRKSRISAVVKELSGEKIDIVLYSKDIATFIARALAPAAIKELIKEGNKYFVIVPDEDLSVAIGKRGQNVNLASKLVGVELEVLKASSHEERVLANRGKNIKLSDLNLDNEVLTKLTDAEIYTAFDILTIPTDQLADRTNYSTEKIEEIKQVVKEALWRK
jgi:N utilization substance protein A